MENNLKSAQYLQYITDARRGRNQPSIINDQGGIHTSAIHCHLKTICTIKNTTWNNNYDVLLVK